MVNALGESQDARESYSLAPCSIPPVQNLVQRLVGVFVALDPLHEILHRLLGVAVGVVGTPQLHLLKQKTAEQ